MAQCFVYHNPATFCDPTFPFWVDFRVSADGQSQVYESQTVCQTVDLTPIFDREFYVEMRAHGTTDWSPPLGPCIYVPEPSTSLLLIAGLVGMGLIAWIRRRRGPYCTHCGSRMPDPTYRWPDGKGGELCQCCWETESSREWWKTLEAVGRIRDEVLAELVDRVVSRETAG